MESLLQESDSAELHGLLADIESADQHLEAAAREYERAARLAPGETNLFNLGSFLLSHNGNDQARIVSLYAAGQFPQSARLRVGLGIAFYALGQYDDAVLRLCEAIDLDPKDTKALDFLGKMSDISPKYADEVTRRLANFARTYPNNAAANYFYGLSIRRRSLGRAVDELSVHYLARATELSPQWAQPHFDLGRLYDDENKVADALREFKTAVRLRPGDPSFRYRLSIAYRKTGKKSLADEELHAFETLQ